MFQRFLFVILSFFYTICSFAIGVIDESGAPTHELLQLLDILHVPHSNNLNDIIAITQKQSVEQGKERWELQEKFSDKKSEAWPILQAIGCIDSIRAQEKEYDYALVLGAIRQRIELRLNFLYSEWKRGVSFKKIVFLTGSRDLNPSIEQIPAGLTTETQMMQFVYDSMNFPKDFLSIPLQIIDTPKKKNASGNFQRPTTADTVCEWLKENPIPGKCLAISDQPFVLYQHAVLKSFLPNEFSLETIGQAAKKDYLPFAVYLDNLAKWLWQEKLFLGMHP